ncbi:hypothetical protein CCR85_06630 [Rhodothalassium salexigens]|uniref:PAS domain-containing protein n=1 Tax=Rhodothalassium salexigens TaxID=1086 RepID=UPI003211B40D|nr:hypothetical protein [Rhodothalassium salexigens]
MMDDGFRQPFCLDLNRPTDLPDRCPDAFHDAANRWFCRCQEAGAVPSRKELDPLQFFRFSPSLYLAQIEGDGDVYLRFAGDHYRQLYGREITGMRLSDLVPDRSQANPFRRDIDRVKGTGRPVYREDVMTWRPVPAPVHYDRLMLPLSQDRKTGTVSLVLGIAFFRHRDGTPWP